MVKDHYLTLFSPCFNQILKYGVKKDLLTLALCGRFFEKDSFQTKSNGKKFREVAVIGYSNSIAMKDIKSCNTRSIIVPRARWRRPRRVRITPPPLLSWSCVSDLHYLKAKAGYALQPSMTRKPQLQSYTIRVWSYETFIVYAQSSSG